MEEAGDILSEAGDIRSEADDTLSEAGDILSEAGDIAAPTESPPARDQVASPQIAGSPL